MIAWVELFLILEYKPVNLGIEYNTNTLAVIYIYKHDRLVLTKCRINWWIDKYLVGCCGLSPKHYT